MHNYEYFQGEKYFAPEVPLQDLFERNPIERGLKHVRSQSTDLTRNHRSLSTLGRNALYPEEQPLDTFIEADPDISDLSK